MSVGTIDIGTTRVEGPLKVAGAAKYAADQYPPNLLHAVLVGSPIAAGRVTGVESIRAAAVPGVLRILTRADMPKLGQVEMPAAITHIPLQTDAIEWEGQAVAMVIAETLEAAEEAVSLVDLSFDPAPPTTPGNGRLEVPDDGLWTAKESKGSFDQGMAQADVRIERSYFQPTRNRYTCVKGAVRNAAAGQHPDLVRTAKKKLRHQTMVEPNK